MNAVATSAFSNLILRALPAAEIENLRSLLEPVELHRGEVLYRAGELVEHIYFPETCLVSIHTVLANGAFVESGLIGYEGAVGTHLALSQSASNRQASVQISGSVYRIGAAPFFAALPVSPTLSRATLHYAFNYLEQAAQIGVCNYSHTVDLRLMRMLLVCRDRMKPEMLRLTQEDIAQILRVNRPNVSVCAKQLKDSGLIDYKRGGLYILDHTGLKKIACECYEVIKKSRDEYVTQLGSV